MRKKRSTRRWVIGCAGLFLLSILLFGAATAYVWQLARTAPEGWTRVRERRATTDLRDREAMAVAVENRVLSALSAESGDVAERELFLREAEIDAWLAQRLPAWAENQNLPLPDEVSGLSFWLEDGQPVIAFRYDSPETRQIVSADLDFEVLPDGQAVLRVDSIRGGRLPLPVEEVTERAAAAMGEHAAGDSMSLLLRVLRGRPFEPAIAIGADSQARIAGFETRPDGLLLHLRIEGREP